MNMEIISISPFEKSVWREKCEVTVVFFSHSV